MDQTVINTLAEAALALSEDRSLSPETRAKADALWVELLPFTHSVQEED